jgi:hypothetical protein
MEEGTNKAIPLRRSRAGTRAVAVTGRRWIEPITVSVRAALEPPRQVWLATLGSAAITLRTARNAWERLVAEGAEIESWLRDLGSRSRV